MKRNYRNLFMVGMMAFAACFTSCKEDEIEPLKVDQNDYATLKEDVRATSAVFTLTTNGIKEIAYLVGKGSVNTSSLDAAVVYSDATTDGRLLTVSDGENTLPIYALEGNTEYTLVLVYSLDGKYNVSAHEFTTAAYERLITIVETSPYGFTFHFEVPDTMCYRYAFTRADMYTSLHMWRASDVDNLNDGKVLRGPQTVTINNGDYWNEDYDPEWDTPWAIYPGTAWVVLMAECDAEGNLLYEFPEDEWNEEEEWGGEDDWGVWAPATRAGSTWENNLGDYFTMPLESEIATFPGLYARQYMYAGQQIVENEIQVSATSTERRIKLSCEAEPTMQYVVAPFTPDDYDYWMMLFGQKGMASAVLENYGAEGVYEGNNEIETNPFMFPIEVGSTYIFSVVGLYNEEATIVSYDTLHVTINKSDRPAATAVVTGIEDPENNPNFVWFNVKSEEQNVKSAMYLMNYSREFIPMLNYLTEEEMLTYYGQELTPEDVNAINSAEGLNLSFTSFEDLESMLLIGVFNEDESMAVYKGTSRSCARQALEPVATDLFEKLAGEWDMTIISEIEDYDYETWESYTIIDTTSHYIRLGGSIDEAPEIFDSNHEAYEGLLYNYMDQAVMNGASEEEAREYAENNISKVFAEYKDMVKKYENYYKSQNYIVGLADFGEQYHEYASPWALFTSLSYSSYDTEELFYDYGPKLFFQVQPDESIQLLTDPNFITIAPMSEWGWSPFTFIGNNPDNYDDMYFGNFPVEVSADKNTVIIKGVEKDGAVYYPSLGSISGGWPTLSIRAIKDIVLTRRTEGDAPSEEVATRATSEKKIEATRGNGRYMRTALPKCEMPKANKVEMVYVDMVAKHKEAVKAELEKNNRK